MARREDELWARLLPTFRVEAADHLRNISSSILELEKEADPEAARRLIEATYREAHSLKGAARSVRLTEIEALCRALESIFYSLKSNTLTASGSLFDLLHRVLKIVNAELEKAHPAASGPPNPLVQDIIARMEEVLPGAWPVDSTANTPTGEADRDPRSPIEIRPAAPKSADQNVTADKSREQRSLRISESKLDSVLQQAEESIAHKISADSLAAELKQLQQSYLERRKQWIELQSEMKRFLIRLPRNSSGGSGPRSGSKEHILELMEQEDLQGKSLLLKLGQISRQAEQSARLLKGSVDMLLDTAKHLVLLPFSTICDGFPQMVREISRELRKQVDFTLTGADLEIDKRILEELRVPLMHMIRNSLDHGIESPDERIKKNKPASGTIQVAVRPADSGKVEILVEDDGRGIDVPQVESAARKLGFLSEEQRTAVAEEAFRLIFHSGVSTSPIVSDMSGRGLGMSIVREKVDQLGGTISVVSQKGEGTQFRILLPLSLATLRGVFIRVEERLFVIPTPHVERVLRVKQSEIRSVEGALAIQDGERPTRLVSLAEVLGLPRRNKPEKENKRQVAIIVSAGDVRVAFQVDDAVREQEVLVKNFNRQLTRIRNIAGATILGSSQVVPVLNAADLLKHALMSPSSQGRDPGPREAQGSRKKKILVVEDSITSRTLLRNILESAGYDVQAAVDGMDAFSRLQIEEFDLVVSDIEMPRMNGFDLTTRIRGSSRLTELPVILVTSMGSREDREKGIDAGANAYLTKSGFDQSNLLEAVRRLV